MNLHDAALRYAEVGWAVFPLVVADKRPVTAHGFKDATDDPEVIDMWWGNQPQSNIGIACGASDLVVLDVDPRNGGDASYQKLLEDHPDLSATLKARTGGGGFHLYFRRPEGVEVPKTVLASGLDLVSAGGYVVAPPSVHPSGSRYEWRELEAVDPSWVAVCPRWLVRLAQNGLHSDARKSAGIGFELPSSNELTEIDQGRRNETMIRVAGAMRRWGMSDNAIYAGLTVHNQEVCRPPLPEEEIRRIAASASRYEPELESDEEQSEREGLSVEVCEVAF